MIAGHGQDPGPDGDGQWWRRRVVVMAVIAAAVVLAAGLTAGLLAGGGSGGAAVVPISAKSAQPAVSGDVYVVYLGGQQANAEIYGEIGKAANGEVARLYAQQFPFKNAPIDVSSVLLHPAGTTARYEFQVTPTIATRYRVSLFRSGTASAPLATSSIAAIYVIADKISSESQKCGRPVCHETFQLTSLVPPSAVQAETAKQLYVYFAIKLAPKIEPAVPTWLVLRAGNGHATASQRISADEFVNTITFSFQIGNDAYRWASRECTMNTETADGIGLPGQHGCGGERILQSAAAYVG